MRTSGLPDDFELTEGMKTWAEANVPQVKIEIEFSKFCDYWWANGKQMANWEATLRNWLRRCVEFKGAALYTQDELRLKKLSAGYTADGFRKPLPHENSQMYTFEYQHWTQVRDGVPKRDMSSIATLVRAKTA